MKHLYYSFLFVTLAAFFSCSSTEDDDASGFDDGRRVYHLTVADDADATRADDGLTRALLFDEGNTLSATWEKDDRLTYCNISRIYYDVSHNMEYPTQGNLAALSNSTTSQFAGDVICKTTDYLALAYPSTTFDYETADAASYVISLEGQDGSLSTLARSFNYQYGVAEVISADPDANMANAKLAMMKSLLTVCRFSFVDAESNQAIMVKTLEIEYGGDGSDKNTYPQTAAVITSTDSSTVHASAIDSNKPLTIDVTPAAEEVYVSLLPTGLRRIFRFTVTSHDGHTYSGTFRATLNEGECVMANGLPLSNSN